MLTFAKVSDPWSPRQQRHLAYISEFTTDVRHIAGKDNSVADALSRTPVHTVSAQVGIDYTAMANVQQNDEDIKAYHTAITGLILEDVKFGPTNTTLLCDVSSGQPRPLVQSSWRRKVFEAVHNLSHPSIRATRTLITRKFMWHGINKQVENKTVYERIPIPGIQIVKSAKLKGITDYTQTHKHICIYVYQGPTFNNAFCQLKVATNLVDCD